MNEKALIILVGFILSHTVITSYSIIGKYAKQCTHRSTAFGSAQNTSV